MSVVLQNRLDEERRRLQEVQSLRRKLEEEVSQLKSDLARQEQVCVLSVYVHTCENYVRTYYVHMYVCTYVCTYIPRYVCMHV